MLEAVVRSFPKQEPIVLQKAFPLMLTDYDRNPRIPRGVGDRREEGRSAAGRILCGRFPNQPKGMQATKFVSLSDRAWDYG